ncbi:hypothetical protein G9A89_015218 [Geosiphon pyriformis]|nr:hypothetical protein G9A89_015218 [Geosiphon pyriformis]
MISNLHPKNYTNGPLNQIAKSFLESIDRGETYCDIAVDIQNNLERYNLSLEYLIEKLTIRTHYTRQFRCLLGFCHQYIKECFDPEKAVEAYEVSSDSGYSYGRLFLGICFETEFGVENDPERAFELYRMSANDCNGHSQYRLARCYQHGIGTIADIEKSLKWFHRSAESGHLGAQNNVGCFYKSGLGAERDLSQAFYWYQRAARAGLSCAQFNLGECFREGQGIKKDDKRAAYWYKKAAAAGDLNAKVQLANLDKEPVIKKKKYDDPQAQFAPKEMYENRKPGLDHKQTFKLHEKIVEAVELTVRLLTEETEHEKKMAKFEYLTISTLTNESTEKSIINNKPNQSKPTSSEAMVCNAEIDGKSFQLIFDCQFNFKAIFEDNQKENRWSTFNQHTLH